MAPLLIVDGMSLLKSVPKNMMSFDNGVAFNFLRSLRSDIKSLQDDLGQSLSAVVCWEGSLEKKRDLVPEYKESRVRSAQIFIDARNLIKELLPLLGISQCFHPDWEADDVIAHLAKGPEISFVRSGDWDLRQTVSDTNSLLQKDMSRKKGTERRKKRLSGPPEMITKSNFFERTGYLNVNQFLIAKLVLGDGSDELKGLNGFGPKRLYQYLNDLRCPDEIRNPIDSYLSSEPAKRMREIITLPNKDFDPDWICYTPSNKDADKALKLLSDLGFTTVTKDPWDWWDPFHRLVERQTF